MLTTQRIKAKMRDLRKEVPRMLSIAFVVCNLEEETKFTHACSVLVVATSIQIWFVAQSLYSLTLGEQRIVPSFR